MWQHIYVSEKLRELENEMARRVPEAPRADEKPLLRPMARRAGEVLRRIGEGLEMWGGASPARRTDVTS
jgi:hypothetical protein